MRFIVLVLAAAAVPARGIDLSGRATVGYSKLDIQPTGGERTTSPHLDLDLGLDASGTVSRPGLLDWYASGSYRRVTDEVNGAKTGQSNLLLYGARAIVFGDRRQPVTLEANASRSQIEFLTNPEANLFGKALVDAYGGTLSLNLPDRPQARAGYTRTQASEEVPGLPTHTFAMDEFRALVGHGSEAYKFIGNYDARLMTGSWTNDNVDQHNGSASVSFALPAGLSAQVNDVYQLSIPRAAGVGTFRQENNSFGLYLSNNQQIGGQQTVRYSYLHGLTETSPTSIGELTRQSVQYNGDFSFTGEALLTKPGEVVPDGGRAFWRLTLDGSQSRASTAAATSDAYGETVGATVYWRYARGKSFYQVHGGPLVALIQSEVTGNGDGYGATIGGRALQDWLGQRLTIAYQGDYGLRLYGRDGWTLRQNLTASLSGAIADSQYAAHLTAQAWRTSDPTLGEGAGRALEARFSNTHRRLGLELGARLADGIAGSTPKEFISDGLIIPAPFNSHSRELRARASYSVFSTLMLAANVAFASNELPGAPSVNQVALTGSLDYRFAAFNLQFSDRVVWYEQGTGGRNNLFLVTVSRRFGARL